MFDSFRQIAKGKLRETNLTYAKLAAMVGVSEATIKQFMCGASDSRRIAELIADALNSELVYSNGTYLIKKQGDNQQ